jgi:hypothetical protein
VNLPTNLYRGDTGPVWHIGHFDDAANDWADISGADYVCTLVIVGPGTTRLIVARTADNKFFVASLTAAETAAMVEGVTYDVRVQISNATLNPAMSKELSFPVFVLSGGVA